MAADTILLPAHCLLWFYSKDAGYWRPALLISTVGALIAWALFAAIRYLKANGFIRTGICVIAVGAVTPFANDIISLILDGTYQLSVFQANLTLWSTDALINANVCLIVLLSSFVIGGLLLLCGLPPQWEIRQINLGDGDSGEVSMYFKTLLRRPRYF